MPVTAPYRPRMRLRTILLVVNLFVLIVPIGSVYFLHLYENELVRQTETELIDQGAYIAAMYKQALPPALRSNPSYGIPAAVTQMRNDPRYAVIPPMIDLGNAPIHPPRPDAAIKDSADASAVRAGKAIIPVIQEAMLTTLAGVRITDFNGVVVAGSDETGASLAHVEEVASALKGAYAAQLRTRISKHATPPLASISRGTGIRLFIAIPIVEGQRVLGTVLLSRSPRNALKGLYDSRHDVVVAGGIVLTLTMLLALLTSYAISRPIHALIAQTQRVGRGEKNVPPIAEPVTQELALLSQNISAMAQTIAERSDYIRNFAMHVSHEFKTPLTAIQGAIELIEEHGKSMPEEQFSKFLANITQDVDRLRTLVSRLLELARADMMETSAAVTDTIALLNHLRSYYHGVTLVTHGTAPHIPLPEDIARTVLGNLIENSIQHGATHVTLTIAADHIRVEDNGRGISAANAQKLFTPFFTTKREQGGTGLGLVVVRSLLAACHAQIQCIPQATGVCFDITFA